MPRLILILSSVSVVHTLYPPQCYYVSLSFQQSQPLLLLETSVEEAGSCVVTNARPSSMLSLSFSLNQREKREELPTLTDSEATIKRQSYFTVVECPDRKRK